MPDSKPALPSVLAGSCFYRSITVGCRCLLSGPSVLSMLAIRIGFMGAGRMATALARGLVRADIVPAHSVLASDPSADARRAFELEVPSSNVGGDNVKTVAAAD